MQLAMAIILHVRFFRVSGLIYVLTNCKLIYRSFNKCFIIRMTTMEFQPPYFPPPFGGGGSQAGGQDVFGQHISADPYQQYAVGS